MYANHYFYFSNNMTWLQFFFFGLIHSIESINMFDSFDSIRFESNGWIDWFSIHTWNKKMEEMNFPWKNISDKKLIDCIWLVNNIWEWILAHQLRVQCYVICWRTYDVLNGCETTGTRKSSLFPIMHVWKKRLRVSRVSRTRLPPRTILPSSWSGIVFYFSSSSLLCCLFSHCRQLYSPHEKPRPSKKWKGRISRSATSSPTTLTLR